MNAFQIFDALPLSLQIETILFLIVGAYLLLKIPK